MMKLKTSQVRYFDQDIFLLFSVKQEKKQTKDVKLSKEEEEKYFKDDLSDDEELMEEVVIQ